MRGTQGIGESTQVALSSPPSDRCSVTSHTVWSAVLVNILLAFCFQFPQNKLSQLQAP